METCKVGLHVYCMRVPLGWHHCNQDHSTVPHSMSLSDDPHLDYLTPTGDACHDLDTTTTLSDSSIVVHDLVLHLATCTCSSLSHLQPIGAHYELQLICELQQACVNTTAWPPLH